jgi:hypothetical protein
MSNEIRSSPATTGRALNLSALFAAALLLTPIRSDAARLVEIDREITGANAVRVRGLAHADFNDDGWPELVSSFSGPASVLLISNSDADGEWTLRQSLIEDYDWSARIPVAWSMPGPDRLFVVSNVPEAIEYAGWPLREVRRFPVGHSPRAGVVADVDLDGMPELLVAHTAGVTAYRVSDGAAQWTLAVEPADVAVAQLDADPALEIIVAGGPGRVFDGATRALEWSYSDGFGSHLTVGRFGSDGTPWFVGARDWSSLIVFRSQPYSPVWDFSVFHINSLASCDIEGDGREEILVGEGQWGGVLVIDAATRAIRRTIPHDNHGIPALTATDFDRDGDCDIAFASSSGYSDELFRIVDGLDGAVLHEETSLQQGIAAVAYADLDGDGQVERLFAGEGSPTRLHVDTRDGRVRLWSIDETPEGTFDEFAFGARRVLAAQLDADPGLEIVLLGSTDSDGRLLVIDSASRTVQRRIGDTGSSPLASRWIHDAAWVQFDGDDVPELAILTSQTWGGSGARISVISLQTGLMLWESVAMGVGPGNWPSLTVMQADADPAPELVVALAHELRAFDAETRLLDWSLTLPMEITASAYDPVRGELYLAQGNGIEVLDAVTRAPLRTLPGTGYVTAIRPIGAVVPMLALMDAGALRVVDALSGAQHGRSDFLGPYLPTPGQIATQIAFSALDPAWTLAVGTPVGIFSFAIRGPESLFLDGFEE